MRSLAEDAYIAMSPDNSYEPQFLEDLWENRGRMLPTDLGGGSAKHFEVTLLTVRKLMETQKDGKNQSE